MIDADASNLEEDFTDDSRRLDAELLLKGVLPKSKYLLRIHATDPPFRSGPIGLSCA